MIVTVLNNQSLIDVAVQYTGRAENFLQIAMANNLVPTAAIVPGTVLMVPEELEKDEVIVNYYKVNNIQPATSLSADLQDPLTCEEKLYECFK